MSRLDESRVRSSAVTRTGTSDAGASWGVWQDVPGGPGSAGLRPCGDRGRWPGRRAAPGRPGRRRARPPRRPRRSAGGADLDPEHYGAGRTRDRRPGPTATAASCRCPAAALDRRPAGAGRLPRHAAARRRARRHAAPAPAGRPRPRTAPPRPGVYGAHPVRFAPGSRTAALFGEVDRVNSYHHQAVTDPGPLTVTGWADDAVSRRSRTRRAASCSACSGTPEEALDVRPLRGARQRRYVWPSEGGGGGGGVSRRFRTAGVRVVGHPESSRRSPSRRSGSATTRCGPSSGSWPARRRRVYDSVLDPIVALTFAAARTSRIPPRRGRGQPAVRVAGGARQAGRDPRRAQRRPGRPRPRRRLVPDEFTATGASADRRAAAHPRIRGGAAGAVVRRGVVRRRVLHRAAEPMEPRPVQRPGVPILLGGAVPAAIRRAGEIGDGWVSRSATNLSDISSDIALVREGAESSGRASPRIVCRVC